MVSYFFLNTELKKQIYLTKLKNYNTIQKQIFGLKNYSLTYIKENKVDYSMCKK